MKKCSKWIMVIFLMSIFSSHYVLAEEINDVYNGNGEQVIANQNIVIYKSNNGPQDPSTQGGQIKISAPYNGNPKDDGWRLLKPGEVLIGRLGFSSKTNGGTIESKPFTVPADGRGPVVLEFENPSKIGDPAECVIAVSVNGANKEWLCVPWEGKRLRFAIPNKAHPKGTQHTTAFKVEGEKLFDVVKDVENKGWLPVAVYWRDKMPKLTLDELMTGQGKK